MFNFKEKNSNSRNITFKLNLVLRTLISKENDCIVIFLNIFIANNINLEL